jgi:hypothetical protein
MVLELAVEEEEEEKKRNEECNVIYRSWTDPS